MQRINFTLLRTGFVLGVDFFLLILEGKDLLIENINFGKDLRMLTLKILIVFHYKIKE